MSIDTKKYQYITDSKELFLDLTGKPVTKKTSEEIRVFLYSKRNELKDGLKLFYDDVAGLIEIQLRKPVKQRLNISEVLERAYNIEQYVLNSGACSYSVEFIKLKTL